VLRHQMHVEASNEAEHLFVCEDEACGRRLVLRRAGGLTVLDRGNPSASHFGGLASLGPPAVLQDP